MQAGQSKLGGDKVLMSGTHTETNTFLKGELYGQYNWFYCNFLPHIQQACDVFFSNLFSLKLISIGKNISMFSQGQDYFVTRVKVDKNHEVLFRTAEDTVNILLERVLGKGQNPFELSKITELEAKIISLSLIHI